MKNILLLTPLFILIHIFVPAQQISISGEITSETISQYMEDIQNPDILNIYDPSKMRGPKSIGTSPIFSVFENLGHGRYTLFLYNDGTVIYRDDVFDYEYTEKAFRLKNPYSQPFDGIIEEGPFKLSVVSQNTINYLISTFTSNGYCDDPGHMFYVRFGESIHNLAVPSCYARVASPIEYVPSDKFLTPTGLIDRNGMTDAQLLANEHPRVQLTYQAHDDVKNLISTIVNEAETLSTPTSLGYIELEWYPVE